MIKKSAVYALLTLTLTGGCSTQHLRAACPESPALPDSLMQPVSTGPALTKQYEDLLLELRESLRKAADALRN